MFTIHYGDENIAVGGVGTIWGAQRRLDAGAWESHSREPFLKRYTVAALVWKISSMVDHCSCSSWAAYSVRNSLQRLSHATQRLNPGLLVLGIVHDPSVWKETRRHVPRHLQAVMPQSNVAKSEGVRSNGCCQQQTLSLMCATDLRAVQTCWMDGHRAHMTHADLRATSAQCSTASSCAT